MRTRKSIGLCVLILLAGIVFPVPAFTADLAAVDALNDSGQPMDPLTGSTGAADQELIASTLLVDSKNDHQAQIYRVQGSVKILKTSTADWIAAEKGMRIVAGDQILTGAESYLEIVYDERFLNIARIDAGTKAEFESIEPTIVRLEDGSIFSALDGLKGSSYQVATPVAVAAVRGTHFEVNYEAATQKFDAAVLPDTREHVSAVEITNDQGLMLLIPEGSEADLAGGTASEPRAIEPEKIQEAQSKLDALLEGVDPSLRVMDETPVPAGETGELPEDEKAPAAAEDSGDDTNKLPNHNDGGNNNNGGGGRDGEMPGSMRSGMQSTLGGFMPKDESEVDSMVDSMIPMEAPAGRSGADPERTAAAGPRDPNSRLGRETRTDASNLSRETRTGAQASGRQLDYGRAMNFLMVGGAMNSSTTQTAGLQDPAASGARTAPDATRVLGQLGYTGSDARALGNFANALRDPPADFGRTAAGGTGQAPIFAAPVPGTNPAAGMPGGYTDSTGRTYPGGMPGGYTGPAGGTYPAGGMPGGYTGPAGGTYPAGGMPGGYTGPAGGTYPAGGMPGGYTGPAGETYPGGMPGGYPGPLDGANPAGMPGSYMDQGAMTEIQRQMADTIRDATQIPTTNTETYVPTFTFAELLDRFRNEVYLYAIRDLLHETGPSPGTNWMQLVTAPSIDFTLPGDNPLPLYRPAGFSSEVKLVIDQLDDKNGGSSAEPDIAVVDYKIVQDTSEGQVIIQNGTVECDPGHCAPPPV